MIFIFILDIAQIGSVLYENTLRRRAQMIFANVPDETLVVEYHQLELYLGLITFHPRTCIDCYERILYLKPHKLLRGLDGV